MNEVPAGLVGSLQAIAGPGLEGGIRQFPDSKELEGAGFDKPLMDYLLRLFLAAGAKAAKIELPCEQGPGGKNLRRA